MSTYVFRIEDGDGERFDAPDIENAIEQARELLRYGDWGQDDSAKTFTVRGSLIPVDEDEEREYPAGPSRTVEWTFEPYEPPCETADGRHDWQEQSAGGSGGGIITGYSCPHCKVIRVTDTCGTDPETGDVMETTEYRTAAGAGA